MSPDEINAIRDRALAVCVDAEAAREAWRSVASDGRCHGKTARAARIAMLTALADGKSIKEAENAAWAVLDGR